MKNEKLTKNTKDIAETTGKAALIGTAGFTVLGAAAIGVAGYFIWKNRQQILGFVDQYVDLPESWNVGEKNKSLVSDAPAPFRSPSINNLNDTYSSNRM